MCFHLLRVYSEGPPLCDSCGYASGPRMRTRGTCALVMLLQQGLAGTRLCWCRCRQQGGSAGRAGLQDWAFTLQKAALSACSCLPHSRFCHIAGRGDFQCWEHVFKLLIRDSPPGSDFPVALPSLAGSGVGANHLRALITNTRFPIPGSLSLARAGWCRSWVLLAEEPFIRTW